MRSLKILFIPKFLQIFYNKYIISFEIICQRFVKVSKTECGEFCAKLSYPDSEWVYNGKSVILEIIHMKQQIMIERIEQDYCL